MKATKIAQVCALGVLGALLLGGLTGCTPPGPAALLDGEALLKEGEYSAAIKKFRKATELLADHAEAYNFLGLAYHRSGDAEAADQAYRQALRLNVDLVDGHYNLGCLLLENGEFEAAESQFKTYGILSENEPKGLVKLGSAQLGAGDLDEAEASYHAALRQSRAFPEAWNGLGLIWVERGQGQDAYHYFNTAIEEEPEYAVAYLNQAIIAQDHLGDLPLALQKYRRFAFLEPNSAQANRVGRLTAEIEEALRPKPKPIPTPVSEAVVEQTTEADPTIEIAETAVARGADSGGSAIGEENSGEDVTERSGGGQTELAEVGLPVMQTDQLTQDVTEDRDDKTETAGGTSEPGEMTEPEKEAPGSTEIVNREPREFTEPNREVSEPAEPVQEVTFEKINVSPSSYDFTVVSEQPENTPRQDRQNEGWRTVTDRRSGMGISVNRQMFRNDSTSRDPAQAARSTGSVQRVPSVPYRYRRPARPVNGNRIEADPYFRRGNQAYRSNRASDAILSYREALARDAAFFEAYFNLGLAAMTAGLPQTALEAYENALAISPDNRNARYNFALALEQGRHYEQAAQELEALLGRHPNDAQAHFTAGTLYARKLGNASLARRHYERVLALDPRYPDAVAVRYWLSAAE